MLPKNGLAGFNKNPLASQGFYSTIKETLYLFTPLPTLLTLAVYFFISVSFFLLNRLSLLGKLAKICFVFFPKVSLEEHFFIFF